ncbi:MAG: TrkH family potassium uptake protein [Xenococcaceae cyanobacterium MO_167.B27]|nr:TrkH family potassium uptake protein [Xenococcaceae cyanobacterium MO_167.B27]
MQHHNWLGQKYRAIFGYTGLISALAGTTILLPLIALIAYPEETKVAWGFLIPGLFLVVIGLLLWYKLKHSLTSLSVEDGSIIVVLSWIMAIAFGTIPFITISGLNFTQAVFESTSGWTTTGLSVIDVSKASHLILLYRSTIQLVGGAGFAILALSAIIAPAGIGIATAEGRSEQLVPNVRRSAKLVLNIYSGYVAVGIVALRLAGMNWFDAVNHAFAALSTGGFSTRVASLGYWDSQVIETVTILLMLLGTLNFLTSYLLLTGKLRAVIRNSEIKLQVLVVPLCIIILWLGVTSKLDLTLNKALRVAFFETITALSTSGFSTVSYTNWSSIGWLVLIVLMLIGGGTGATAGGIKQFRIYALYRGVIWEVRRQLLPKDAITEPDVWQGETRHFFSDRQLRQISMFVFLYLGIYIAGSGIIAAIGYSLPESLFEYASALSTVGLSVGVTTPDAPIGLLWTEIAGMFLGRLEFFPVFVGLIRIYQDILTAWE